MLEAGCAKEAVMPENDPATDVDSDGTGGPKELREALSRKDAENKKYRGFLMENAFTTLGLDPTKGIGKAIAKEFDGDPTVEAVEAYAVDEYGWEKPTPAGGSEEAALIETAQQRVAQATAGSVTAQPPSDVQQQIRDAEAKGDWVTTMTLKTQQLREILESRR